jgi:flagellar biosynthesis protein FliP
MVFVQGASAQGFGPSESQGQAAQVPSGSSAAPRSLNEFNPLDLLNDAGMLVQGASNLGSGVNPSSSSPDDQQGGVSVALNIMLLLTVIALVPSIMLMTTSFVRIMVVLALLRQAMGTQSLPPAQVVTGLALFMTALVMKPTVDRIWSDAVVPYQNGEIREMDVLWERASNPVRDFMFDQIEATDNWSSLYMILNYQGIDTSEPGTITRADISTTSLVPAYMLSELKVAFLMGFRVYLPFLVIDMVIASLLISMSMMMLPPVLISLPFKLMLFVMVDGWTLIVGSLLESFVQEGDGVRASAMTASMIPLLLICKVTHPRKSDLYEPGDDARSRGFLRGL